MIDEALDRLRESNPVPGEVNPAPIDALLARIQSEAEQEPRVRPHRHTRLLANLVPALAVGVAVAVAAVAIVVLAHRQRASVPATNGPPKVPIPLPRHGMLGVVAIDGATYAPGGLEMISVAQCFPCAGGTPAGQRDRAWRLTTTNGGVSWTSRRAGWLDTAQFSGAEDGWAGGAIGVPGVRGEHAYVTHDGGKSWTIASTPAGWSVGGVSVAGGAVWAVAVRSQASRCPVVGSCTEVLRGSAAGSSLAPVASQPVAGSDPPLLAAGGGAGTAYIDVARGINRVQHLVTRDEGRTWQTLPRFCPYEGADRTLTVDGAGSLWRFCWDGKAPVLLGRSANGGRTYRTYHVPAPGPRGAPFRFEAMSEQVAWEMTDHGDIIRITKGGAHAAVVWRQSTSQVTTVNGIPEGLTARDADTAYVTVVVGPDRRAHTTGSYIVVYVTHDGGRVWTAQEVLPPTG